MARFGGGGSSKDDDRLAFREAIMEVFSEVKEETKNNNINFRANVTTDKGQIIQEGQKAKEEFEDAINPVEITPDLNGEKTKNQAKKISTSIDQLLNKDYSKGNLTKNLEKSFNAYNSQVAQSVEKMSLNGTKAAYNYYSAFNAAMEAGIDKNVLNQYVINDSYRSTTGDLYKNIGVEIDAARKKLEIFLSVEKDVKEQLGNIKINNSLLAKMNDYANKSYYDYSHPGDSEATYAAEEAQKRLNDAIQKVLASQNQLQQEQHETAQSANEAAEATNKLADANKKVESTGRIASGGGDVSTFDDSRLRKAFDEIQKYTDEVVVHMNQSGAAAANEYYRAYEEALKTGAPKEILDKYILSEDELVRSFGGNLSDVITEEITVTESVLKNFATVYEEVTRQIRSDNISEEVEEKIGILVSRMSSLDKDKMEYGPGEVLRRDKEEIDEAQKQLQEYLNSIKAVGTATKEKNQEEIESEKLLQAEREKEIQQFKEMLELQRSKNTKAGITANSYTKTDGKIPEFKAALDALKGSFETAGQIIGKTEGEVKQFVDNLNPEDLEKYEREINDLIDALKKLSKDPFYNESNKYGKYQGSFGNIKEAQQAFEQLTSNGKSLSNVVHTKLNSGVEQFTRNIVTAEGESQKLVGTFKDGKLYLNITKASQQTNAFSKFTAQLADRWRMLAQYVMSFGSFYQVWGWVKQGVQVITELDTSLTEMRKVSNESLYSLKEYAKASFDIADAVGTTSKQLQDSTADFMRIGESMDEAAKSAQAANVLLNVSEFDNISEATDALIAMSAAFDDLSKTEINDVLNNLGNNFAISTDGLATALQDAASALKTAQNDFYESAAIITAGNAVSQSPSKVGKAARTIALRLTGTEYAKEQLQD